jgi:hypothetical protein
VDISCVGGPSDCNALAAEMITTRMLTRREFVRDVSLLAVGLSRLPRRREVMPLRIALVTVAGSRADARRAGVTLGVEEARHAAAMFGGAVELTVLSPGETSVGRFAALIGDDDTTLLEQAERAGVLYLNVGSSLDALRGVRCHASLVHIAPSEAMMRDALAAAHAPSNARVASWNASLEKFGADTLNERFTSRFSQPMTPDAWNAWFAVKVLWEASLRARSTEAAKLRDYLVRESTQFDGHKGRPLSFRPWDRQLRQPVYVVADGRVSEWPPAATGEESARESLDRIGVLRQSTECRAT